MKYKLDNAVEQSVHSAFFFHAVTLRNTEHMLLLCYLIQDVTWHGAIIGLHFEETRENREGFDMQPQY